MISIVLVLILTLVSILDEAKTIKKGKDPHTLFRYFTQAAIIFGAPALFNHNLHDYLIRVVCSAVIYWFFFDYGLNIARGDKPLMYLSDKGLDKYQQPHMPWFVFKAFLAITGLVVGFSDYYVDLI